MTANAFAEDCRLGKAQRAQQPWKPPPVWIVAMTANAFAEDCRLGKAKRAQHPWKQIKPSDPEQFNAMLLKWLERDGR